MSFRIPTFNLLCNIWHGGGIPPAGMPDISDVPCQLAWDRIGSTMTGGTSLAAFHCMLIRVAKGTDLRGKISSSGTDVVECPAGSGRYYAIGWVDDVAKGFANEFRQGIGILTQCPTPLP